MAKVKEINSALQIKLNLISKITELLKQERVNVSYMNISLETSAKKKKSLSSITSNIIHVDGKIVLKINADINPEQRMQLEEESDDELLEDFENEE